jgi:PAS domain S-box-containing protein
MRFTTRLTTGFIGISVIVIAIVLAAVYFRVTKNMEDEIMVRMQSRAIFTMDMLDRFLYERAGDLAIISQDPVINSPTATAQEITKKLIFFRNTCKFYISLSFFNLDRVRIADTAGLGIGGSYPLEYRWKDILVEKVSIAKSIYTPEELKTAVTDIASLVTNKEGKAIGVVVARIPANRLFELVKSKAGITQEKADLVDQNGFLLYSNRNYAGVQENKLPEWERIKKNQQKNIFGRGRYMNPVKKTPEIYVFCREQGYLNFKGNGWTVIFYMPGREVFDPIAKLLKILIAIFLMMLLPVGLMIYFFSKTMTWPLTQLSRAAADIGRGKLDTVIKIRSRDEVGFLADDFKRMVAGLKNNTTSMANLNKEIGERKQAEEGFRRQSEKLFLSLQEAHKSREIMVSMLDDNNKIREKIAQSEEMFRNIFDEAGDGILITDPESNKFFMGNKAICRMLGVSREEIKNLGITDIHPEESIPDLVGQLEGQRKGELRASRDLPIKRKDGTIFYADVDGATVNIAGKTYLMGFFHDITERREIADLKRIDRLKKDFISNMSHELRTPLNAVIGFSEVLIDQKFGALNETQRDYLNDILESGKFLLSLINDILDLAKIESGKMELAITEFSLRELLEHSLIFIKEKALKHNIELSLKIDEKVGRIRADERKVRQIIFNLLSNAVKFTPDGGKAGIKARINGLSAEVTVWDTGIGIAQENLPKLFMPFTQLESSLSRKYEGTGLGLSLTKELVELHKGKIWVQSQGLGHGAGFIFSLPLGMGG